MGKAYIIVAIICGVLGAVYGFYTLFAPNSVTLTASFVFFIGAAIANGLNRRKPKSQESTSTQITCNICGATIGEYDMGKHISAVHMTGHAFTSGTIQPDKTSTSDSMEILKTRYAKGEITKEQFNQMKHDLE